MAVAALADVNPWQPRPPGGLGAGVLLALLAHALLIGALALGVHWRNRPSEVVMSAELWAAVPQVAAPAPVEPPPTPQAQPPRPVVRPEAVQPPPTVQRDAEIAIEKARRQREQALEEERREKAAQAARLKEQQAREEAARRKAAEADAKARTEAAAKARAAAEAKARADAELARQREENLARIRGQAGATGGPTATGNAARDAAPSVTYAGRIKARIKPNIVLTTEVSGNPIAEVEVRCAPDGRIIGRRVVKPSGNAVWDETVLRAIDRTEVLPRDLDGRVPGTLLLVFPRQE